MILQNLYNKVIGFFRQTDIEQEKESTKETACNRLRVVLMQDRTNLTPELMERMRREMVDLLSKYVEMDKDALELNLEQDGDQVALMLSIPVIRAKDEDEIKAALEAEDKGEKAEETEEEENEEETEEDDKDDDTENKSSQDDSTDIIENKEINKNSDNKKEDN